MLLLEGGAIVLVPSRFRLHVGRGPFRHEMARGDLGDVDRGWILAADLTVHEQGGGGALLRLLPLLLLQLHAQLLS